MSEYHARTVSLVLNVETALVTPQYHVKFDDLFRTVAYPRNQSINTSAWKVKAGFLKPKQTEIATALNKNDGPQNTVTLPQTDNQEQPPETTTTIPNLQTARPQRQRRPPTRLADYVTEHESLDAEEHDETTAMAFAARKGDQDSLYLHEAMKAPDANKFREAMQKEIQAHESKGHWMLVKRSELPQGVKPLPAVWAMK